MRASPEATGTIYDIGYRRYEGARLGRWTAMDAIFRAGLRASYGMGRSGRSKIIPWGLLILGLGPALVAIAVKALAGDIIELFAYHSYIWQIGGLLPLFMAAQGPELVVSDIRNQVMPLYLSRPISRVDYVAARVGALAAALLGLTLFPVLVLFLGRVLLAPDIIAGVGDEAGALPGIVGNGLLHAVVLALLALAISAYAGRRAFAAGGILAVFLLGGAVSAIFAGQEAGLEALAPFTDPLAILDGTRQWLFGTSVAESPVGSADVPLPAFGGAALLIAGASAAALAWRYRRVGA